jgi:hypothetical protein
MEMIASVPSLEFYQIFSKHSALLAALQADCAPGTTPEPFTNIFPFTAMKRWHMRVTYEGTK